MPTNQRDIRCWEALRCPLSALCVPEYGQPHHDGVLLPWLPAAFLLQRHKG